MKSIWALALATLALAAPAAKAAGPSNLHAVSITDTDIVLAWSPATGTVNYAVFFDDNPTPFLTSAETRFDVHLNRAIGMIPGSTHTFRVRAESASGELAFSNALTVSFAPGDNTPPTAPGNLRVANRTAAGVELAWNPSSDEHDVVYSVAGAPCPLTTSGTSVLVPSTASDPVCGIVPGSTATFTVTARDELDNVSARSNSVTVTF
jgi:chitinase